MKTLTGLLLATMLAAGALAQAPDQNSTPMPPPAPAPMVPAPTPPAMPPPSATPPAAESVTPPSTNQHPARLIHTRKKKKKTTPAVKHNEAPLAASATPLGTNAPAIARQNNVNVRGQANINSEVLTHLKKGETVTVLAEITLKHPKTDEPARWAKIALPQGAHAWVNNSFLDDNKAVKPAKLNIRSGPGENFSVIGLLHKGDTVRDIATKGDWTEIDAPADAYGYVAAHLLEPKPAEEATQVAANPPPTPAPTPTPMEPAQQVAPPPSQPPMPEPSVAQTQPVVPAPMPSVNPTVPPPAPEPEEEETNTTPRIVEREGIVRGTVSIQAPSYYELSSLDNGRVIDYLFSPSPNLFLGKYKGLTVLVTGEEALDERWPNTPVVTIQKIQVVK